MKELVKIISAKIGDGDINAVDARDLHEVLGVKKDFSNWIKDQITRAMLVENIDFIPLPQKGEAQPCGFATNRIDYFITLDAAKHIAMLSHCEKGRQARLYFIACEKKLKQVCSQFHIPQTLGEALKLAYEQQLQIEDQEKQLTVAAPKVEAFDTFISSEGYQTMDLVAKALNVGVHKLFRFLKMLGILKANRLPMQPYIERGYFTVHMFPYYGNKKVKNRGKTLVSPQGVEYLRKKIKKNMQLAQEINLFAGSHREVQP